MCSAKGKLMLKEKKNLWDKAVLHYQKMVKVRGFSRSSYRPRRRKNIFISARRFGKTKENIYVQVNQLCRSPYNEAIAKRIEQGYNHKNKAGELKAIRKDAVHSINVILSGSHEEMTEIANNKKRLKNGLIKI